MMRFSKACAVFTAGLTTCVSMSAGVDAATASFQGLGDLPGGVYYSDVRALSADGSLVLGRSRDASGYQTYLWTAGGGMTAFAIAPGGSFSGVFSPHGISGDGSVFVGAGTTASGSEAYRWSQADGLTGLGDLPGGAYNSTAVAASSDGSVVVGYSGIEPGYYFNDGPDPIPYEPFLWTAAGGMVGLGGFAGETVGGYASDVSADGSVVVGYSTVVTSPGEYWESYRRSAFRWTQATGMIDLGFEKAVAVSADGSTVVGYSVDDFGIYDAYRWTESTGRVWLGEHFNDRSMSQALDVSGDGSVIVGISWETGPPIPVIWDAVHGSRDLKAVLVNDYGLDLTGWIFEDVIAGTLTISDDGLTIAGWAINPNGDTEAFIATLPEPGGLILIVVGSVALMNRRGE